MFLKDEKLFKLLVKLLVKVFGIEEEKTTQMCTSLPKYAPPSPK